MEGNGSDVSALVGLDGFVVRAQVLDEVSTIAGYRSRHVSANSAKRAWVASSVGAV